MSTWRNSSTPWRKRSTLRWDPAAARNYQIPASFVEAVIDRMAQVVGKATRQESALVVAALDADHRCPPWLRAGHRVRNWKSGGMMSAKANSPRRNSSACRGSAPPKSTKPNVCRCRRRAMTSPGDVDLLPRILVHGPVQVHQSDSQSLGMRGRSHTLER